MPIASQTLLVLASPPARGRPAAARPASRSRPALVADRASAAAGCRPAAPRSCAPARDTRRPRREMPSRTVRCRQVRPSRRAVCPLIRASSGTTASMIDSPSPSMPSCSFSLLVGELQRQRGAEFVQRFGPRLNDQRIAFAQHGVALRAVAPLAVADQTEHGDIVLLRRFVDLEQPLADQVGPFRHRQLGDIVVDLLARTRPARRRLPLRDQPPADQRHEDQARRPPTTPPTGAKSNIRETARPAGPAGSTR